MLLGSLDQSSPQIVKKTVKMCCTQMSPHINLFPGKVDFEFSVPKTKGTIQTFISNRSKSKRLMVWRCSRANSTGICAKVLLTWRHIFELYREIYCHQDDVFHGKSMVIRSRQCQLSFCMCYNSVVSNVLDSPACSPDLTPIENV